MLECRSNGTRNRSTLTRSADGRSRFRIAFLLEIGLLSGQSEEGLFQSTGGAALLAQFVTRTHGDEAALMNDANAVGHFLRNAELVGGKEDGHAGARTLLEHVLHDARVVWIEAHHRL